MNDLISRRAAIKAIEDLPNCYNGYSDTYDKAYIIGVLEELPPAEPKKGKWETKPFIDPNDPMKDTGAVWCRCSECKNKLGVFQDGNFFDYCPNCGAKMERGEDGNGN